VPRWFGYITIFFVSAFVLHFAIEAVVPLITDLVAPSSVDAISGPVIFVADFVLAGVATWLIVRFGGQFTRSEEDKRRGDAFLDEERRRVEAAEQQHLDDERLERLQAEVSAWQRARDLRAYAGEALAALGDGDATTTEGGSLRDELLWALAYADRIDPLRS